MWIRSSRACSGRPADAPGRRRRRVAASTVLGLLLLAGLGGAAAQQRENFNPLKLDAVTRAVVTNAFTQLRFQAILLEGEDETGQALNGIVRARLARGEPKEAVDELTRIDDPIWYARSLAAIADYQRDRGAFEAARDWLAKASARFEGLDTGAIRDGGEVLRLIAVRQAAVGDRDGAIATARRIPDLGFRIQALQETATASQIAADNATEAQRAAAQLLEEAFTQAQGLPKDDHSGADVLIEIGRSQVRADDLAGANATFEATRARIAEGPQTGRFDAYARLAAAMIEGRDPEEAMQVVRLIPEGAQRAEAIGSVARARGELGDLDSAVPLFRLAVEEAERIESNSERYDTFHHLIVEMTRVGRLADAFTAAAEIRDQLSQSKALLDMGEVLLDQEKYAEALTLTDYIPYIGLRAQLFGPVAMHRGMEGDPQEASALLSRALEPTGLQPILEFLPDALKRVLRAQTRAGEPDADAAIFARARDLIDLIPGDIQKVRALVQIAIAQAQRGRIGDSQKTISAAYRTAWENKEQEGFTAALEDISLAQIAAGDILSAYDTAARIASPPEGAPPERAPDGSFLHPRFRALTRVAAASARLGETDLAIRAAQQMDIAAARAAGLAAVAVAMASPETDLLETIGQAARSDLTAGVPGAEAQTPPPLRLPAPTLDAPETAASESTVPAPAEAPTDGDAGDGPRVLVPGE